MDIVYVHDIKQEAHMFLSMVDDGTTYHVAVRVANRDSQTLFKALMDGWMRPYGCPDEILTDLERGLFGEQFVNGLESLSVRISFVPAEAHWQLGKAEVHGHAFATIHECRPELVRFAAQFYDGRNLN